MTSLSAKDRIPLKPALYDLLVIDEASQCDIASVLPLLFRAKRVAVIGDRQQLRHISNLTEKQDRKLLESHHLDYAYAYSVNSLFDMATASETPAERILLQDHHRSCKEIAGYSNQEFYGGVLRVVTSYRKLVCPKGMKPGIRWIDCAHGTLVRPPHGSLANLGEVEGIIGQLQALADSGFEGSVGVISPFRAQVDRIREALAVKQELRLTLKARNALMVDSVHGFQGDERDVILFSPVIAPGATESALRFLHNTGNIFNVAVSRARSVLIVVGHKEYCRKCGIPYLEHFVEYVENGQKEDAVPSDILAGREYPKVKHPEQVSDWERSFYSDLFDAGISTYPQYPVGAYTLDLAVVLENGRKLDIEVDGEAYHRSWDGERCYHDLIRTQYLESLKWSVMRFWVYQIRDRRDWCIHRVRRWIEGEEPS